MKRKIVVGLGVLFIVLGLLAIFRGFKPDENQELVRDRQDLIQAGKLREDGGPWEEQLANPYLIEMKQDVPDLVAWIRWPESKVDYPVVQGGDNEFYLDHNAYQNPDQAGAIYVDYEVPLSDQPDNIILYGHNMRNKDMFGDLTKLKDPNTFANRPLIYWETPEESATFKIVGVAFMDLTDPEKFYPFHQFLKAEKEEDIKAYVSEFKDRALAWDPEEEIGLGDQLMTLVTCTYETQDARLLVLGKKR